MNIMCYNCNNFGHIAKNCRLNHVIPIGHYNNKKSMLPKVNNVSHTLEKKNDQIEKRTKKV